MAKAAAKALWDETLKRAQADLLLKKRKKNNNKKKPKPVRSVCDQCETGLDATTRDDNVKHEKHV